MQFNHVANRLDPAVFRDRRRNAQNEFGIRRKSATERTIWLRQPGANVDSQFSRSPTANRDADKLRSQISFLSETPRSDLEALAAWVRRHGMSAEVGSYSDREFYLDAPAAFVDFVIEAMRPDSPIMTCHSKSISGHASRMGVVVRYRRL